jgi:hypothetical protein
MRPVPAASLPATVQVTVTVTPVSATVTPGRRPCQCGQGRRGRVGSEFSGFAATAGGLGVAATAAGGPGAS